MSFAAPTWECVASHRYPGARPIQSRSLAPQYRSDGPPAPVITCPGGCLAGMYDYPPAGEYGYRPCAWHGATLMELTPTRWRRDGC